MPFMKKVFWFFVGLSIPALLCLVSLAQAVINPSPDCLGDFSEDNPASISYYSSAAAASAAAGAGATLDLEADANGIWGVYNKQTTGLIDCFTECILDYWSRNPPFYGYVVTYSNPGGSINGSGYNSCTCNGIRMSYKYSCHNVDGTSYAYITNIHQSAYTPINNYFAYPLPGHAICASSDGDGDGIPDQYDMFDELFDQPFKYQLIGVYYTPGTHDAVAYKINNLNDGQTYIIGNEEGGEYVPFVYIGGKPTHDSSKLVEMFGVPDPESEKVISKYDYSSYGIPDSTATGPASHKLEPDDSSDKVTYTPSSTAESGDNDSDLLTKIANNTNAGAANQKALGDLLTGLGKQNETIIGKIPTGGDIGNEVGAKMRTVLNEWTEGQAVDGSAALTSLDSAIAELGVTGDLPEGTMEALESEVTTQEGVLGGLLDDYQDFFSGYESSITVDTSGSQCSFSYEIMGHTQSLDMCGFSQFFSIIGAFMLGCSYIKSFFIIFGRG